MEHNILIRRASAVDLPAMARIMADNFDHAMPEHSPAIREKFKTHCSVAALQGQLDWKEVFVVSEDMAVVGTGALANFGTPDLPRWSVSNFFIAPEAHGRGYGRLLLSHLITLARKRGASELHVPSSLTAIGFYRKYGFVAADCQSPEDTADEITWMTKRLS